MCDGDGNTLLSPFEGVLTGRPLVSVRRWFLRKGNFIWGRSNGKVEAPGAV